jgi:hypothetical protein
MSMIYLSANDDDVREMDLAALNRALKRAEEAYATLCRHPFPCADTIQAQDRSYKAITEIKAEIAFFQRG